MSTSNLSTAQSEAGCCGFGVNTGSLSRQFYLRKPNKQKSKKNKQAKVLFPRAEGTAYGRTVEFSGGRLVRIHL